MRSILVFLLLTSSAFAGNIYGIKDTTIEGKEFNTDSLKNKVVLIVNIASQCGYTPQLDGLETLYKKFKDKGFVLLGVPTNDFGGQTPEDDAGMKEFCSKKYNVSFPLLKKKTVKGKEQRSLYKFLTKGTGEKYQEEVAWNFEKFLIDKNGVVVGRFKSSTTPEDKDLNRQIEEELKK